MAVDIRKPLRKYVPVFLQAQAENVNEADTVQRLSKFFEEALGYDPIEEVRFETRMKGKYVDMCLKIDGTVRILLEAKAAGVQLRDRHAEQAHLYASQNNYRWVLLTNGVEWILHHLTFDEGIEYERAFTANLSKDDLETVAPLLALLHRSAVKKGEHDAYWERRRALSATSIGKALFSQATLEYVRREIRKQGGMLVDVEDLASAIHDMLSTEAREHVGPAKIRKRLARKPVAATAPSTTETVVPAPVVPGPATDGRATTDGLAQRAPGK